MDLDRDCLELMLNLLESDVSYQQALDVCGLSSAQLEKNKQKVRELCAEIQSQGHAMHLNLESITVSNNISLNREKLSFLIALYYILVIKVEVQIVHFWLPMMCRLLFSLVLVSNDLLNEESLVASWQHLLVILKTTNFH